MDPRTLSQRITAVAALDDPVRRAVFDLVAATGHPIPRDEVATALNVPRSTAAFHLERLVTVGLLEVEFRRLGSSGRPSKLYRRASTELAVSVPSSSYGLAGTIMAAAIDEVRGSGGPIDDALHRAATRLGETLGREAGAIEPVLENTGYEPIPDDEGGWDFGNCPFHQLARDHTATVCGINGAFLAGALDGAPDDEHTVDPPRPEARCCARVSAQQTRK
ncbi:helix-turn-helix domain-containing protein [Diaminobutyricimonas sp. TR449]|uniref:helix-turn-helix transcriptional regulator n=1 Tax=Diaminobutyricimonas sp. TR449 TaxID=2708076 RepID=UPI00141FCAE2|nr:helix-turn-helix domain-containing protein [Diaminobutyricimonas sp. TR449]